MNVQAEIEVFVRTIKELNEVSSGLEDLRLKALDENVIHLQLRDSQRKVERAASMLRSYVWSLSPSIPD